MMRKICVLVPLLLLLAVCGQVSVLRTENFLHYRSNFWSWKGAQAHCRQKHTDLVTIGGEKENQDFLYSQGWIGLYRENSTSNWKWSRRDEIAVFTNWESGFPKPDQNCAFKYNITDKWESHPCDHKHSFMCYNEKLVLVKKNKTWEQALEHCRNLEAVNSSEPATAFRNHRYDLATLLTLDDHVYAREKAKGATTNEVWTGLRYLAGQWLWVSGQGVVTYKDIKSCQTQRYCGILVKNGTTLFETSHCKRKINFLCSRKP
ncbi:lymphocyte antigen 75-like [Cottoperca gobio]|uniref:Lymphocyte antigen 75-like n=1 Tax=Cottoperca gobio TaxID=56716 RepID=A0A6J2Q5G5_COTGO|nr:lymphocyte antigen 75-like [Cottoperca gobio]